MQINDQQAWAGFMKSTECENAYPPSINSRLSDFQRVLIIQVYFTFKIFKEILRQSYDKAAS